MVGHAGIEKVHGWLPACMSLDVRQKRKKKLRKKQHICVEIPLVKPVNFVLKTERAKQREPPARYKEP